MIYFLMPIALLLLPFCVVCCTDGYKHNLLFALLYFLASVLVLYLLIIFDNGFDASDSMSTTRLLAPFFILSFPLAIATIGIVGWLRKLRNINQ